MRRAGHQEHVLAERRIGDPEGDRVPDQPGVIRRFLDLGRAHPVTGCFDHFVRAADEIEEPIFVPGYRVARPDGQLREAQAGQAGRSRPETLSGPLRVVPVPHGHECAAVDELTLFAGITQRTVGTDDEDLGVGNGFADRARPPAGLGRIEESRPERLGQPVHEEGICLREQ